MGGAVLRGVSPLASTPPPPTPAWGSSSQEALRTSSLPPAWCEGFILFRPFIESFKFQPGPRAWSRRSSTLDHERSASESGVEPPPKASVRPELTFRIDRGPLPGPLGRPRTPTQSERTRKPASRARMYSTASLTPSTTAWAPLVSSPSL